MNFSKQISQLAIALAFGMSLTALSTDPSQGADQPRVYFTEPGDGATVASPVKVTIGAENFVVEPAGAVKAGAGHLHIMVDTDCVPAGNPIPKNAAHLHFGKGQMKAELKLSPGPHTFCLQAADGNHIALEGEGLAQKITVTVK
jgi:hypothetical protein